MKNTLSMRLNNSNKIINILLYSILGCCLISAIAIFILALTHDTTLLGDPYYEDKILAPQRALVPWLMTIISVGLALLLLIVKRLYKK